MNQTILLDGAVYHIARDRGWQNNVEEHSDAWDYAHSMALICPRCLQQWCILAFAGDEDLHPQGAFCERHGDGCLLLRIGPVDIPLLNALPLELLQREFRLTIKRLESEWNTL